MIPSNTSQQTHCSSCGTKRKKVGRITLESLLTPRAARRLGDAQYRFCDSLDCDTVYFAEDGSTFSKADLTVRVGVKERTAPRHVCYCFDHTIEEINDEVARTGVSTVLDDIKTRMATACWCETKSPMGTCCLGTVSKYVKLAIAGQSQDVPSASDEEAIADCCAFDSSVDGPQLSMGKKRNGAQRAGVLATGGSVLTAVLSSACCWLPLLLLAFGTSAAGVSMFFERWRPYFAVVAIALLGLGFYFSYFRASSCKDECCSAMARRGQKLNRATLWVSTVVVMAFVLFPKYVGVLMDAVSGDQRVASAAEGSAITEKSATFAFDIGGMSCEACAVTLKAELKRIPGVVSVAVDYDTKSAVLSASDDTIIPEVIEAAKKHGYSATVSDGVAQHQKLNNQ